MGEYAKRKSDGQEIKIGTCSSMYYLRYEDRAKVEKLAHSLDPATAENLYWRLPFLDEDKIGIGEYNYFNRGLVLHNYDSGDYSCPELAEEPGLMQITHRESGLLLNIPCHHGEKLPDVGVEMKAFWNGKRSAWLLSSIKNGKNGIVPVIRCQFCHKMWSCDWDDIWDYISTEMQGRLEVYKLAGGRV